MMTLEGYAGTGKCLADDQLVQTPSGPVAINSLRPGDQVFGLSGDPIRVLGVYPQGERQSYRVTFRDGASVECDIEHLWAVQTHKQRQIGSSPRVMTLGEIIADGLRFKSGPHKFCVPLCQPVAYPPAAFPIHPYLLGLLIGDGTDLGKTPTLCTPDFDSEIVESAKNLLPGGFDVREDRAAACPRYRFVDTTQKGNRLTQAFRDIGLAGALSPDRFIPVAYMRGSVEQRWQLLRGLMDTDGSCVENRTTFSTKSARLADDIADLARSLGGIAVVSPQKREGEIQVNVKTFDCPFSLRRKARKWSLSSKNPPSRFIVDVQPTRICEHTCIKVEAEDGLFLTNGYIVTHNTTLVGVLLRELANSAHVAVAAPTNKAVGVLRDKIGDSTPAEFRSIHSFLGLRMSEREDGSMECKPSGSPSLHEYDLAIVDECSMIGDGLFTMILGAARTCRVLFVGDPAQLPPIDQSSVVPQVSPTFGMVQHRVMLSEVVRQAADNPIIALSMQIRHAIEAGRAMTTYQLADALSEAAASHVSIAYGGEATIYNWALGALQAGMDARIICYTNQAVENYNRALHGALYDHRTPFAIGERIIVNEQYDEARLVGPSLAFERSMRVPLYTSEEAMVEAIEQAEHPFYPQIPAFRVVLYRGEDQPAVFGFVPADRAAFEAEKSRLWQVWRNLKAEEIGRNSYELRDKRTAASQAAILFTKAFMPIRHVYAITAHKSQGSTIDTVIVDYNNLSKIKDPFTFNRSLYVAATRAARFLAVVG